MSSDTLRDWLIESLKPLLPAKWKIAPGMQMPQTLAAITVAFKHAEIIPLPEAPKGHLDNKIIMAIADPHLDQVKAEELLDHQVLELLVALQDVPNLRWTLATKVQTNDIYIGWDITCSIITRKKED